KIKLPIRIIIMSIFFFLAENIIKLDPLRISLLLTVSSMILMINYKMSKMLCIWVFFIFIIGLLIRIESGLLAIVLVTIAEIVYKGFKKIQYTKFSLFYFVLLIILVFINLPIDKEDE